MSTAEAPTKLQVYDKHLLPWKVARSGILVDASGAPVDLHQLAKSVNSGVIKFCPPQQSYGARRRRHFTSEQKAAIVSESTAVNNASAIARKYAISTRLMFSWRKQYKNQQPAGEG